jgi:hypothetical protein
VHTGVARFQVLDGGLAGPAHVRHPVGACVTLIAAGPKLL